MLSSCSSGACDLIESFFIVWFTRNDDNWLETESKITISDLHQNITTSIKKQYAGWEITGVDKIDSAKKGLLYEADIKSGAKKKEVLIMEDGTFSK